jgi:uncharacterized membrane protein YfcA
MLYLLAMQAAVAASGSCNVTSDVGVNHFNDELFGEGGIDGGRVVVASLLCFLITNVAVAAGIGGGGLLVPLYFISLGIPQTRAVSLSKGTIFGVACGNFLFISREKHPKANRPLIDYPTAIFMQGGELMGVVIGVLLNLLLPQVVTIIISAIVLGFNAYKTLGKARVKYAAETAKFEKEKKAGSPFPVSEAAEAASVAAVSAATDTPTPPPSPPTESTVATSVPEEISVVVKGDAKLKEKILAEQAIRFPPWAWVLLLLMCTFFVIYSLLMAKVFDPNFTNCVPGYWPAYVTPFVFYGLIILYMARRNVSQAARMAEANVEPIEGDIRWSRQSALMLVPAAIGAGVAAGLLGIGGGMILGPIFVALNFQPQVGTATTGFMILFTAMGGTVKYLSVGKLAWRHFLWFAGVGGLGGYSGQRIVKKIIAKTGRPSYIVFILGGIIALAVIVMTTFGLIAAVEDANCGIDIWKPDASEFICVPTP